MPRQAQSMPRERASDADTAVSDSDPCRTSGTNGSLYPTTAPRCWRSCAISRAGDSRTSLTLGLYATPNKWIRAPKSLCRPC